MVDRFPLQRAMVEQTVNQKIRKSDKKKTITNNTFKNDSVEEKKSSLTLSAAPRNNRRSGAEQIAHAHAYMKE